MQYYCVTQDISSDYNPSINIYYHCIPSLHHSTIHNTQVWYGICLRDSWTHITAFDFLLPTLSVFSLIAHKQAYHLWICGSITVKACAAITYLIRSRFMFFHNQHTPAMLYVQCENEHTTKYGTYKLNQRHFLVYVTA